MSDAADNQQNGRSRPQIKLNLGKIPGSHTQPDIVPPPPPQPKPESLSHMIQEEVAAAQVEAQPAGFKKEMVCVKCGLLADVDMDVPSCACPDCGGTMYPNTADHEQTITYLEDEEAGDNLQAENPMTASSSASGMHAIKVAQPVNVGIFTGNGAAASTTSSQKGIDFLSSSSSSSSSIRVMTESQKNLHARISELEMTVKNLEEEKAELHKQQEQLEKAIADFNEKRKAFEQYRLEFELRTQSSDGQLPVNPNSDSIRMAKTFTGFRAIDLFAVNNRREKILLIALASLGGLVLLLLILLIIK